MSKRRPEDDIHLYGAILGLSEAECEAMASGGSPGARRAAARDLYRKYVARFPEPEPIPEEGHGQIQFWQDAGVESFVYFVQAVNGGPVKIGMSKDPVGRLGELQVGNPNELAVRYVAPGDRSLEAQLHHRFRDARVRGEWFGLAYLELILAYAAALAEAQIDFANAEGEVGVPIALVHSEAWVGENRQPYYWETEASMRFVTQREVDAVRTRIESLHRRGHTPDEIATLAGLTPEGVYAQMVEMRRLRTYDLSRPRMGWAGKPRTSLRDYYVERDAA